MHHVKEREARLSQQGVWGGGMKFLFRNFFDWGEERTLGGGAPIAKVNARVRCRRDVDVGVGLTPEIMM